MVKVEWTEAAVRDVEKLDKQVARRIIRKLNWLSKHFSMITPEPLSGEFKGVYKLRVGDWRVIYTIENDAMIIQSIGHRREIYKADIQR